MQKKKILIVDDEKNLAIVFRQILESHGYETHIALDGKQGVESAKDLKPDVIVLDIKMPKKDGISVLKELRSIPQFVETPIIVLSAKGQLHEINMGLKAGASTYLCKPVMPNDIIMKIEEFLS
jgi:DNA-binding response OmpR family regulator